MPELCIINLNNQTMQKLITTILFSLLFSGIQAQSRFSNHEISINGFRNPSIGAEYRYKHLSVHGGYYPTAFKSGESTGFVKSGLTLWFLPIGKKENPSSFYAGASYLRGQSREYDGQNALGMEAGFRWMIRKGFNLRIGAIAVAAKGKSLKINPTPGISYSFFIR
jgi:hypothetical protein